MVPPTTTGYGSLISRALILHLCDLGSNPTIGSYFFLLHFFIFCLSRIRDNHPVSLSRIRDNRPVRVKYQSNKVYSYGFSSYTACTVMIVKLNEVVIHVWQGAPIPVKGRGLPVDVDSFPGQSWTIVRLHS